MHRNQLSIPWTSVVLWIAFGLGTVSAEWSWRGPYGDGHAPKTAVIPSEWSEEKNVLWATDVPGRGHSSPIVVKDRVFLTTADESNFTQSVLCYDLQTGEQDWATTCYQGVTFSPQHAKNTQASPSIAAAADRVFAVFCNNNQVHATCLDFDGKILWRRVVGQWIPLKYQFGFGQSPIYHDGKLIVTSESETDPFVAALDPQTGDDLWRIRRSAATSYSTPVIAKISGREQLMLSGGRCVAGYDPTNGQQLWEAEAPWDVTCGTMVWHPTEPIVYASGGYPNKQTLAIRADGTGEIVWKNPIKCYEQSMIVVDGCVYAHAEGGILYCWDGLTGKRQWRQRLSGAESASPVFADGRIHLTNEASTTWVIRPNREKFDLVAENQLEEEMFASIAVMGNRIVLRVADHDGSKRQERLYCIGR